MAAKRFDDASAVAPGVSWAHVERELLEEGFARVGGVLSVAECHELSSSFDDDALFRSRVNMDRHAFGSGDYAYFRDPLPVLVETLRTTLYERLAPVANAMMERMKLPIRYPAGLASFRNVCRAAGQSQPTPLLLRYEAGGYNRLHRDLYGEQVFPLQATILLSDPVEDFDGGEFLLVENAPRRQAKGEAVRLERGEMIVFATNERPVHGARGFYRAQIRHGVSRVRSGRRLALGIIFHDAR